MVVENIVQFTKGRAALIQDLWQRRDDGVVGKGSSVGKACYVFPTTYIYIQQQPSRQWNSFRTNPQGPSWGGYFGAW